jgi:hypothetical protein
MTVLVKAFTAFSADAFEILASFPTLAINSAFVIQITSLFTNPFQVVPSIPPFKAMLIINH